MNECTLQVPFVCMLLLNNPNFKKKYNMKIFNSFFQNQMGKIQKEIQNLKTNIQVQLWSKISSFLKRILYGIYTQIHIVTNWFFWESHVRCKNQCWATVSLTIHFEGGGSMAQSCVHHTQSQKHQSK